MRNLTSLLVGSAAIACVGVASNQPAHALYAFGAGSTAAQIAYRQLLDCMYDQAQGTPGGTGANGGPLALSTACTGGAHSGSGFAGSEVLYAGTGSGNGKSSIISNNVATITAPSNSIPWTDSTIGITATAQYDGIQFGGSDDPLNLSDINKYATASGPTKYGNLYQIPSFIIPIAIGLNGTDGTGAALNIANSIPSGGSSGLNLSRQALCGIAAGYITTWNNSILTALNNNVALGTGNITFIHRLDGSGSTFLLTNALQAQCQTITGPNFNAVGTPTVSYALPWTDHTAACPVSPVGIGTDQANWPDLGTDQCGNAIANPGGGHYNQASGSGALVTLVQTTQGAIGYASVDYWAPINSNNLKTANLQGQWDILHGNNNFIPPTAATAQNAMASAEPQFNTGTGGTNNPITDPLAWTLQGVVPNPGLQNAYPISGFTWVLMYQCYQNHANTNNAYITFREWLDYMYGAPAAANIINANGFATLPSAWITQIYGLLSGANGPSQMGNTAACQAPLVGAY